MSSDVLVCPSCLPSVPASLVVLKLFTFFKDVSDTVFDMINAAYCDKPLGFIEAIRLSLSRLFLTLY